MRFLITTLAEYQTAFWAPVGAELRRLGHEAAFLSFDDRSSEMLERAGLTVFSAVDVAGVPDGASPEAEALFARFGIDNVNPWITHERFAFGLTDSTLLRRKLASALLAADRACRAWLDSAPDAPVAMVQELGGFSSVVGSFFAARANGIDNWFIEPSFYRSRMFFLRNSFAAPRLDDTGQAPVDAARDYLRDTAAAGTIVIPLKDRHHYSAAYRKVVNLRNARRLVEKLRDKHLHGKTQEFGHIGHHVTTHARMMLNSRRLASSYTPLDACGQFVYYPLHVPGDMALTLRSPMYLDQLALIDFLCRTTPLSHRVVVKEHPAMVGAIDAGSLRALAARYDNLAILPPTTNNYAVLRAADLVISVNSKSGAEAGLVGRQVVVLGDAFYRHAPFARPVDRLADVPEIVASLLRAPPAPADEDMLLRFFSTIWEGSHPGELYIADPDNVAIFTRSMLAAIC